MIGKRIINFSRHLTTLFTLMSILLKSSTYDPEKYLTKTLMLIDASVLTINKCNVIMMQLTNNGRKIENIFMRSNINFHLNHYSCCS